MSKAKAIELLNEAYNCVEIRQYQQAKDKLEKALTFADDISDIHNEYALVLTFLNDDEKAKKHIDKSIELAPSNPKFWVALANWQFRKGKYDDAMTSVTTAGVLDPKYPSAYLMKAQIAKKLGVTRKEIKEYRKKAKDLYTKYRLRSDGEPLKPGELEAFLGEDKKGCLGLIGSFFFSKKTVHSNRNIQLKNKKKNKKRLNPNVIKELVPINSRTKYWRGNSPGMHPLELLRIVENDLRRNPHDHEALHQKAACLIALGRFKDGEKACKKILDRGGDNPIDVCNYAVCLATNGWLDEAIEMIDVAKKSLPFAKTPLGIGGQIYFNSALLHYLHGKIPIGKDDYNKSKELGYHDKYNPFI